MRKYVKEDLCKIIKQLADVNETLLKKGIALPQEKALEVLTDCQQSAVEVGNRIEKEEGEGTPTVSLLEEYCEKLYQLCMDWATIHIREKELRTIRTLLNKIKNSILYELSDSRREIVFLPYKASMWDSMESVWQAAQADEDTDVYVIPIPYYDKNPDGTLRQEHYEAELYSPDIPITDYREYDFEVHIPDAIFIHNPYDGMNLVTTVHPFFYSKNLRRYTNCLVYIPYYATAGGMSEGQALCPAYIYADYIVIQAEKYRQYFDERIPQEKFLAFGSPKFDSVIRKCQQLPKAPVGWDEKMTGRKVYFYNTSIGGMLGDTKNFLAKMKYVFDTFEGRNDTCLLWRPHPLLESTFLSMRKEYWTEYENLKNRFLEQQIGIYDTSPSIETAIAYSDAYVGDEGTSVTSLFGVVGKPLFILDNRIHHLPAEEDWKGLVYYIPSDDHRDEFAVIYGNKLYYSPNNDFHYKFYCDLSEYAGGNYYARAYQIQNTVYVLPQNAEHILVIDKNKNIRKIELEHECEQRGAFTGAFVYGENIFILPGKYSSLICFKTETEEITYVRDVGTFNYGTVNGVDTICGRAFYQGKLFFLHNTGAQLLILDLKTLQAEVLDTGLEQPYMAMFPESEDDSIFWLLPFEGTVVVRWNYRTGEKREYDLFTEGLKSFYQRRMGECQERYFGSVAVTKEHKVIFAPMWANMYVSLDIQSGNVEKWASPFENHNVGENEYFPMWRAGMFIRDREDDRRYQYWCARNCRIYDVNLITKEVKEQPLVFDLQEVEEHVPGFSVESQWMQYCCNENAFHTLEDFLNGTLPGSKFDREKQLKEFAKINASVDGRCGERVYQFVKENL